MSAKRKLPVLSADAWRDIDQMSPTAAKELFAECIRHKSLKNLVNIAQAGYGTGPEGANYFSSLVLACARDSIAENVLPAWLSEAEKTLTPEKFQALLRTQLRRVCDANNCEGAIGTANILIGFGADPFYDQAVAHKRGFSFEPSSVEQAAISGNLAMLDRFLEGRVFDADHPMPTFADTEAVDNGTLDVGFVFRRRNMISLIASQMTSLTNVEESLALVREHIAPGHMEPLYQSFEYGLEDFTSDPNKFGRHRKSLWKIHEIGAGATPRPTASDGTPRPIDWRRLLDLPADERGTPLPYFCLASTDLDLVPLVLQRFVTEGGLDVNAVHPEYGTLLHHAAWEGNGKAAQKLLELGADASLSLPCMATSEAGQGMIPAEVAEHAEHHDVAKIIRVYSAHSVIAGVMNRYKSREEKAP